MKRLAWYKIVSRWYQDGNTSSHTTTKVGNLEHNQLSFGLVYLLVGGETYSRANKVRSQRGTFAGHRIPPKSNTKRHHYLDNASHQIHPCSPESHRISPHPEGISHRSSKSHMNTLQVESK